MNHRFNTNSCVWSIIIFIVDNHKSILRRLTMSSNVGAKLPIGGNSSLASKKHSGNIDPNAPGHAKTNGLVITSEDVNVLVYRYLQESGKLSFINILVFPGCFRGSFSISVSRKLKPYVRLLSFLLLSFTFQYWIYALHYLFSTGPFCSRLWFF